MKKYIAPALKVVNVENEVILAGSVLGVGEYDGSQPILINRRGRAAHYYAEEEFLDEEEWD